MNGNFLIPANSKKSLYIFGLFKKEELIMFGICVGATLLCMAVLPLKNTIAAIIALMPALIGGLLIMPVPNYHNVLTVLRSAIRFYTERQCYVWKGWCFLNGEQSKK